MVRIDGTLAWVAASDVHRFEEEQRAAVAAAGPGERGQRAAAHRAACGGGIVPSFLLQAQQSLQDLLGSLHAEDIAGVVALPFRAKQDWFAEQCGKVRIPYSDGRKSLEVERSRIVESTAAACRSIDQRDYRKTWRIRFKGEEGLDAGGLYREWFQLVTSALFDPALGVFTTTAAGRAITINPASAVACPDRHLELVHLAGRLVGKALLTGSTVACRLSLPMLKHILGVPLSLQDVEAVDKPLFDSLKLLLRTPGVDDWMMTFAVDEDVLGRRREVELKPGGASMDVTDDNKHEFVALRLRHRMLGAIAPQLTRFLAGIYEVVPERLLSVFDFQELDLLLSGMPKVSVSDWKRNTIYEGEFRSRGAESTVIKWFWGIVEEDFTDEERARLLQFVTGSAQVPSGGFARLTSYDGIPQKFTITSMPRPRNPRNVPMPRASTCFNRLYLGIYDSREELRRRLTYVSNIELADVGFQTA